MDSRTPPAAALAPGWMARAVLAGPLLGRLPHWTSVGGVSPDDPPVNHQAARDASVMTRHVAVAGAGGSRGDHTHFSECQPAALGPRRTSRGPPLLGRQELARPGLRWKVRASVNLASSRTSFQGLRGADLLESPASSGFPPPSACLHVADLVRAGSRSSSVAPLSMRVPGALRALCNPGREQGAGWAWPSCLWPVHSALQRPASPEGAPQPQPQASPHARGRARNAYFSKHTRSHLGLDGNTAFSKCYLSCAHAKGLQCVRHIF